MSSDTTVVTVIAIDDRAIDLRVRTTTAGGLDDIWLTRSFALLLLADARRRARELGFPALPSPTPLEGEKAGWEAAAGDWFTSVAFMEKNVSTYVESTEVRARHNVHGDAPPERHLALVAALARVETLDLPAAEGEAELCQLFHNIELRVRVTDARWLEGIEPGLVFPSTAFDVWWDDPRRPAIPPGSPPDAAQSRWHVLGMDEKFWMIRLEGASHTVQYGKLGTKGQRKTKTLVGPDEAKKDVDRLLREKTGKGYESLVDGDED